MKTSPWYSNDRPKSKQDRFWDDYIRMMYWSQDHAISMLQNETTLESISKWWRT